MDEKDFEPAGDAAKEDEAGGQARHGGNPPGTEGLSLTPLDAGVGDAEAVALGVALGVGADLRDHHGEIAALLDGVMHTRSEQGVLESAAAKFGNGGCSAEERDTLVQDERAGRAGRPVELGEEARALVARGEQHAGPADKIFKFGVLVGPAAGTDVAPEGGFVECDDADADPGRSLRIGRVDGARVDGARVDGAIEHVAELDGAVAAFAQKLERAGPGQRADLVDGWRAPRGEEALDLVEGRGSELFEQAEAEGLGGGRVNAVEDERGPRDLSRGGTATGDEAAA